MNWLSFHIASGASLFSGALLLIVGALVTGKMKNRGRFFWKLTASAGLAFILMSSTPFPGWAYVSLTLMFIGWITFESIPRLHARSGVVIGRVLLICSSFILTACEIPHQVLPSVPNVKHGQMFIVGDSISAGIDENPTWSDVYQKRYGVKINNLAKPAATIGSALKQSTLIPTGGALILLEIGGNDLLGKTTPAEFRNDLKKLLASLYDPSRTIEMFELPLLPGQAELGRAQRSLTKEYGVYLVPKRYFCNVLSAPQATIDGLHLSLVGSSLMADLIHAVVGGLLK